MERQILRSGTPNGVVPMTGEPSSSLITGKVRKLLAREQPLFRDHLLRLCPDGRRMRFASNVSDDYVKTYAARMTERDGIVYAYIVDGDVRGAAELRRLHNAWPPEAEAAFSVEEPWHNQGIATVLMGRIIRAARNRGVSRLVMSCLTDNAKMQMIARKYKADLQWEDGSILAKIRTINADYMSLAAEAIEDRVGLVMAALDLQARLLKTPKA